MHWLWASLCSLENGGPLHPAPSSGNFNLQAKKMDKYRIEDKGRRWWLVDKIDSILCRTSYFAPWWFEKKELAHPILHIVLVQFILCAAETTFAFSSVFILLLCRQVTSNIPLAKVTRMFFNLPLPRNLLHLCSFSNLPQASEWLPIVIP